MGTPPALGVYVSALMCPSSTPDGKHEARNKNSLNACVVLTTHLLHLKAGELQLDDWTVSKTQGFLGVRALL